MKRSHTSMLTVFLLALSLPIHAHEEYSAASSSALEVCPPTSEIFARTFTPFTGAVSGSKVRMRVNPTLEGHVVRETVNGEMFIIIGETNDFYAVVPPKDAKGYVFRTFILDGAVEGERVNVRLYPDIDAPIIGQLNTGDKVESTVSEANNKWLEIALPENSRFYIAKEYVENKGPVELLASIEKKRAEAAHVFSAASLFAQAEIQKPFEQIDLDRIQEKFDHISKEYHDVPAIMEQVKDVMNLMQDIYVQKKMAFLESKASNMPSPTQINPEYLEKLAQLGIEMKVPASESRDVSEIASAASNTIGLSSPFNEREVTDKMLIWQPLEEAVYHLWAAANGEKTMQQFYSEEQQDAMLLTGIVEPYTRPVKNRPGDFLLRDGGLPVAFLYSTRINLEKLVGQKVTLWAAPRPNHNFAFPAYFVISVE